MTSLHHTASGSDIVSIVDTVKRRRSDEDSAKTGDSTMKFRHKRTD